MSGNGRTCTDNKRFQTARFTLSLRRQWGPWDSHPCDGFWRPACSCYIRTPPGGAGRIRTDGWSALQADALDRTLPRHHTAPRGVEPRSSDSQSEMLSVAPRGHLWMHSAEIESALARWQRAGLPIPHECSDPWTPTERTGGEVSLESDSARKATSHVKFRGGHRLPLTRGRRKTFRRGRSWVVRRGAVSVALFRQVRNGAGCRHRERGGPHASIRAARNPELDRLRALISARRRHPKRRSAAGWSRTNFRAWLTATCHIRWATAAWGRARRDSNPRRAVILSRGRPTKGPLLSNLTELRARLEGTDDGRAGS